MIVTKLQLLNVLLFALFFGMLCSHLAKKQGRNPRLWAIIGFLFGAFGIALLFLMPLLEKHKTLKKPVTAPSLPAPQPKRYEFWYYLDNGHHQHGPVDFTQLANTWKEQNISYLWTDGMHEWKKLSEMDELLKDFKSLRL